MNDATNTDTNTATRFLEYYKDRDNWGGAPLVGGNVGAFDPSDKGYIVNMKTRGWIQTFRDGGDVFISFTTEGVAAAEAMLASSR